MQTPPFKGKHNIRNLVLEISSFLKVTNLFLYQAGDSESVLKISIGILSENDELLQDFRNNYPVSVIRHYKSLDSIKPAGMNILCVDVESVGSAEEIQFHLSKIRKKLQSLPVLLMLRIAYLDILDIEWFFDEFIIYPFRKGELCARINNIVQNKKIQDDENIISVGNLLINISEYSVYLDNIKQNFTYKEFELLRFLAQNRGVVFSRQELLNRIWGLDYIGGTRTVDVHIRRLRGKLGNEFNSIIETVRNIGYRCRKSSTSEEEYDA